MNNDKKHVYFIVGEPSGDLLASRLMRALKRQLDENVIFSGVGGESMTDEGFKSLFNISTLSVMGFFEVLPRIFKIINRINKTVDDIIEKQPDVIISVDSWGFVSAVLKKLKKKQIKIPVIHYVAPQVWAWKAKRAEKVPKLVDRLMTLMPHEPDYFRVHGLKSDFVGHPVIESIALIDDDETTEEFKSRNGIPLDRPLLCVLPGSRKSETSKLIPVFKETIEILNKKFPDLCIVFPTVNTVAKKISNAFFDVKNPNKIIYGQQERYNAFRASSVAIAASGTVSLELAIAGTPHVIAYTFNKCSNALVKKWIKIKYANLINLMADKEIIPEFVLEKCDAKLIADEVEKLLLDKEKAQMQVKEAQEALKKFKANNRLPSDNAAQVVMEVLGLEFDETKCIRE